MSAPRSKDMTLQDLTQEYGSDTTAQAGTPPQPSELKLTEAELNGARLTPTCIVRDLIYADVAALPAPGGTGKTTLKLYEMVRIGLRA